MANFEKREYSSEEIEYLKANHASCSVNSMARHIGVSPSCIRTELKRLGLAPCRKYTWYSQEDEWKLIELAQNKTAAEIADILGKSEDSVKEKAAKMGVILIGQPRRWQDNECKYLSANWNREKMTVICKELRRSKPSIMAQARRMGLPPADFQSEDIPLAEFCRDTGISRSQIMDSLVPKYDFPIRTVKPGRKRIYYYVIMDDILGWLQAHQEIYDASGIPEYYLGEEPDWLAKKRKADYKSKSGIKSKVKDKRWTKEEAERARDWQKIGLSHGQIAERLGRTELSVRRKLQRMGEVYQAGQFWRGSDFKFLQANCGTMTDEEIGNAIGRSAKSVAVHRRSLGINKADILAEERARIEAYIQAHWVNENDAQMAASLGVDKRKVRGIRNELGLMRK